MRDWEDTDCYKCCGEEYHGKICNLLHLGRQSNDMENLKGVPFTAVKLVRCLDEIFRA